MKIYHVGYIWAHGVILFAVMQGLDFVFGYGLDSQRIWINLALPICITFGRLLERRQILQDNDHIPVNPK